MPLVDDEKLGSHYLRDFLTIRDDVRCSSLNQSTHSGGDGGRHNPAGLTLHAILNDKRSPPPNHSSDDEQRVRWNRTLLDVIREDRPPGLGGGRGRLRQLRAKIRLRNDRGVGGSALSSAAHVSDPAGFVTNAVSYESTQPGPSVDRRFEYEGEDSGAADEPVRMSLMALLAENDRQKGVEGSAYVVGDDGVSDAAEEERFPGGVSCCVCMVRVKGAAFIPCGHTFCRLCSRELLAQRGNCPLCNNHISRILDLF